MRLSKSLKPFDGLIQYHQRRVDHCPDSPSSSVATSLKFPPPAVLLPFLTPASNSLTAILHPSSPISASRVPQNSNRNSLGNLVLSAFLSSLFRKLSPKQDLRRPIKGGKSGMGA